MPRNPDQRRGRHLPVFYVTQFGDEIYVLHCFTKKTQKTSKKDIDTGERRYKEAKRMHEERKGSTR
jgi:phage-related protein